MGFLEIYGQAVDSINHYLYTYILVFVLVLSAVFYSIMTRFIQIKAFAASVRLLINSRQKSGDAAARRGISSFQAFCTGLGARVGTGNVAGVAVALTLGGPGAIFWMWVMAFLSMATACMESTLAQIYKVRDKEGGFRGGPAYYMRAGLKAPTMAAIFSLVTIVTFGLAFNALQANTIAHAFEEAFAINMWVMGWIVALLTALVIWRGVRSVGLVSEWVVPVMALTYLAIAVVIIGANIQYVPLVLWDIVRSAFGFSEVVGGFSGYVLMMALINGVRRGLYSNEAGIGSAPNVAGAAAPHPNHPAAQGLIQMFGVFVDTIILCTCTALLILLSGVLGTSDAQGIALAQQAFAQHVGSWGGSFIAIILFVFAFTSIIANYYYGETNVSYLCNHKEIVWLYRLLVLMVVVWGATSDLPVVWATADITMGIMASLNLYAVFLLRRQACHTVDDFYQQVKRKKEPSFSLQTIAHLPGKAADDVWKP